MMFDMPTCTILATMVNCNGRIMLYETVHVQETRIAMPCMGNSLSLIVPPQYTTNQFSYLGF